MSGLGRLGDEDEGVGPDSGQGVRGRHPPHGAHPLPLRGPPGPGGPHASQGPPPPVANLLPLAGSSPP